MDQGQLLKAIEDAGKGVASGLADTTGSVLDVGGLIKNAIADEAHKSAHWWEDQYEIPNSEAGKIGSNIGTDAVTGLLGGVAGKIAGNAYKGLKLGGETLRRDATRLVSDRQKMADDYVDYGHKFLKNIGMESNIAKGKVSAKDASTVRQNAYENLTNQLPHKPLNSGEPLIEILSHNIKRNFDSRAMLQKNDKEIEDLFNHGISLDDALRIQQTRWQRYPNTARDAGVLMGIAQ